MGFHVDGRMRRSREDWRLSNWRALRLAKGALIGRFTRFGHWWTVHALSRFEAVACTDEIGAIGALHKESISLVSIPPTSQDIEYVGV